MENNFIKCPKCGNEFELNQAITNNIEFGIKKKYESEYQTKLKLDKDKIKKAAQKEIEEKYAIDIKDLKSQVDEKDKKIKELDKRDLELRKKEREISEKETALQKDFDEKIKVEKAAIEKQAKEEANKANAIQLEDYKNQIAEKESKITELNKKQLEINKRERELKEKEQTLELEFEEKLKSQKADIERNAKVKYEKENALQTEDTKNQLSELNKKLSDSQKERMDLHKKNRELESAKQDIELEAAKKLAEDRDKLYKEAKEKSDSEYILKIRDKEEKLKSMQKTIEELKEKSERGSQQLQGEAQELELEDFLIAKFPTDNIQPVPKGKRGADVIQIVINSQGNACGTIIWESKRTTKWSDSWLSKLKEDQREAKADISVIVSQALPEDITTIGQKANVWISSFSSALGISIALRDQLIKIKQMQASEVGKNQKMETLYQYLCSNDFTQRIGAIVESFTSMKEDLESEKRLFEKQWAKREKQITNVVKNTSGMYGDLQALMGAALPEVKLLELEQKLIP